MNYRGGMQLRLAHQLWILLGVFFGPLLLALRAPVGSWGGWSLARLEGLGGALGLSAGFLAWSLFWGDLGRKRRDRAGRDRAGMFPWVRGIGYAVLGAASVGVFYGATGTVIQARGAARNDGLVQGWDQALLGALFPDGQVSLWLDAHSWVGPGTFVGKALTELFQVSYFSYYLWGYGLLALLSVRLVRASRQKLEWKRVPHLEQDLLDFLCAWAGAYWVNFVCYIVLPVIGPKFDYPQRFTHSVDGFGFARMIQDFIASQQAVMEDCFPSGHTALSWITAIAAWRFAPRYARVVTPVAFVITLATLYLRYHYVADVLAASMLIGLAVAWGALRRRSGPNPEIP